MRLDPLFRGDTCKYVFTLSGSWTGASFTGGVKFTLRKTVPRTSEHSDASALHQSSVANGEITFVGAVGTVEIPASMTTNWEPRVYFWDLQGVIAGAVPKVYTIDSGELEVLADIGRGAGA